MYDFVIIDTPPIMAVTDPSIIGRHAGTTMLVVGFAKNTVKEVEISISRFEKSGVSISGLIVNGYVKKQQRFTLKAHITITDINTDKQRSKRAI